jgi:hypothetical protein
MRGIMTFPSLSAALGAGYEVYDRTNCGYQVRTRTKEGWAIALVVCNRDASLRAVTNRN